MASHDVSCRPIHNAFCDGCEQTSDVMAYYHELGHHESPDESYCLSCLKEIEAQPLVIDILERFQKHQ